MGEAPAGGCSLAQALQQRERWGKIFPLGNSCLGNGLQSEPHNETELRFPSRSYFSESCRFISFMLESLSMLAGGGTVLMCLHAKYAERIPTVKKKWAEERTKEHTYVLLMKI